MYSEGGGGGSLASGIVYKGECESVWYADYAMDRTDEGGEGCQFQVQYLYEMEVGEEIMLRPNDGEEEEFRLMGLDEVYHALRHGEFKLNCGMTWMAYLVRHGIVNAENEPDLVEICSRLHRRHDLFIV